MKYNRVLLKLSGEALMGSQQYGIDPQRLNDYAKEIKVAVDKGAEIAIVMGGGNIFRGLSGMSKGVNRLEGDYMGMLATVINSMALHGALENMGVKAKLLGALSINPIVERVSGKRIVNYLADGYVVLISGGTGNPYFTTDTAAALRAIEMQAEVILKGTRVDGIYNTDPEKDPKAIKYNTLSFEEAIEKKLKIMDLTAFTLCQENNMPIHVFNMNVKGNLAKIMEDGSIGTRVSTY
ncbi:MAG TPA: UMP kinase [Bacteroidales bacterium]|nr:UMP kinase [Bacteroidales bacterium]HQH15156.1 UMP kinase [Bacteroidales bacterium]